MATAKNLRTIIAAGTSNSAGGTTTGTALNLTAAQGGGLLTWKVTTGGTGPTVAATVTIQTSGDNVNWKTRTQNYTGTASGTTYEGWDVIPFQTMYVNVTVSGNTAQAVTCEAFLQESTTI